MHVLKAWVQGDDSDDSSDDSGIDDQPEEQDITKSLFQSSDFVSKACIA